MKYKKWSLDQKLKTLSVSEEIGIVEACRKYSVSTVLSTVGKRSLNTKVKQV